MTNRKMPWIVCELHNINYVMYLVLEKERRIFYEILRSLILSIKIRSNNYGVAQ